jgi:hypothetical protein
LNKSVEHWVTSTKPQPAAMHKVINQIARFLADFSKMAKSSPRFLRVGIDLHSMELFGIHFEDIKADISQLGRFNDGEEDKEMEREKGKESSLFETVIKEGPAQFPTDAMVRVIHPSIHLSPSLCVDDEWFWR